MLATFVAAVVILDLLRGNTGETNVTQLWKCLMKQQY